MNLVDSSGWIEYLLDTPRAEWFAAAIEQREHLLVPVIALYEVHRVLSRKIPAEALAVCLNVMRMGLVLELSDQRAIAASEVAQRHRLAMADAVMYSMALEHQATFLTQDQDYRDLPGVRYFPKT